ncbi:hypothetical protein AB3Y40_06625 [Yoonia sp. R2331]|uniref:hypothetical protein n=1 Tax=Yoonia sp. R2331 TaxID=3237238 RepID=UPI0034E5531B
MDDVKKLAEALDAFAGVRSDGEAGCMGQASLALDALTAENARLRERIAELEAGPKVKPLVWEDHPVIDGPVLSMAVCLFGTYFVMDDTDDFSGLYLDLIYHDNARWWQSVRACSETLLERIHEDDFSPLKNAAQADYEARIRAALQENTDGG